MNAKQSLHNVRCLLWNLLLVYIAYTVCRLLFISTNNILYPDVNGAWLWNILSAGLIFDSSAIAYTNLVVMVMFLLPLHFKDRAVFYKAAKWIYMIVNSLAVIINLSDAVYFAFTGKRTTGSVVYEFSHEGTGNLARIFIDQALVHWPLVVGGVAIIAMLWFGFRKPIGARVSETSKLSDLSKPSSLSSSSKPSNLSSPSRFKALLSYYIAQFAALVFFGALSVAFMRGGFSHAVRPITISNANQYVDNPTEAGAVLNTPFALIRTCNKKPFVTPNYMTQAEAKRIYTPEHNTVPQANPENKAALSNDSKKPMNVVILIMESFSKQHIGFYNKDIKDKALIERPQETFTPFLDSLITNALTYRYSYANGRKSIDGMPSILASIPYFVEPFFLTPASMNSISGIARELSENKGYTSVFYHGAENGSMGFEAFARSSGFQHYVGRTEFNASAKYHGDDDYDGTWAIWDEEFLQFYIDDMERLKQPFVTSVFTASSHTPFDLPKRYIGKFPKGRTPIQETVAYSDNALRQFFNRIKHEPWFGNTLFVITADHTSGQADPLYKTTLGYCSVPIIFYAPGFPELRGYDLETIVNQIDIMPTVLSLLGYDKPYIGFGQDIMTTPKDRKFAIHYVPEFDGYEIVKGDYCLQFDGTKSTAAYNFKTDPLQKRNILKTMPKEKLLEMEILMKSIIQQYMDRMNNNRLLCDKLRE